MLYKALNQKAKQSYLCRTTAKNRPSVNHLTYIMGETTAARIQRALDILKEETQQFSTDYLQKQLQKVKKDCKSLLSIVEELDNSSETTDVLWKLPNQCLVVDIICDRGRTWKKVIDRNPQSMHLIWAGNGQYGDKDAVAKLLAYQRAARELCPHNPAKLVAVFPQGITHEMANALESYSVKVTGGRVTVSDVVRNRLVDVDDFNDDSIDDTDSDQEVDETPHFNLTGEQERVRKMASDKKIFLDSTTMIVYVSDVCNGGADFNFTDRLMAEQASDERKHSAKGQIETAIRGRTLVTCETALQSYKKFMELLGGPKEKRRAQELIERLTVVPDVISNRLGVAGGTAQLKRKARTIFGTADALECITLTANGRFLRAAAALGVHIAAMVHQSRALSELRRLHEEGSSQKNSTEQL